MDISVNLVEIKKSVKQKNGIGAKIENGMIVIDTLSIEESNPWCSFSVHLEGYKAKVREIE